MKSFLHASFVVVLAWLILTLATMIWFWRSIVKLATCCNPIDKKPVNLNPGKCEVCDKLGARPMRVQRKFSTIWVNVCKHCQDEHDQVAAVAMHKETTWPRT